MKCKLGAISNLLKVVLWVIVFVLLGVGVSLVLRGITS